MTKKARSVATNPLDEPLTEEFKRLCTFALQLALEADGAPKRSKARACGSSGYCHCTIVGNAPLCHAGQIPAPVAVQAALMIKFLDEAIA